MKKRLILLGLIVPLLNMANPRIKSYELLTKTNIPKNIINSIVAQSSKKDFDENVLKEVYSNFMNSGLVEDIDIKPMIDGDKVKLRISIKEIPNVNKAIEEINTIEDMKKPTPYTIKNISIKGTTFNTDEFLKHSPLKVGEKFTVFNGKLFEKQAIDTGYFKYAMLKVQDLGNNEINLELELTQNPIIKSVKVNGVTLIDEISAIKATGLRVGDVLNLNLIYNSPLIEEYKKAGYNWVGFKNVNIDDDGNVTLDVQEVKVSKIEYVASNRESKLKTKQFVLERNTYIKKGDVLNQKLVEASLRELQRTGLFSNIVPDMKEDPQNPGNVIITFVLTERPSMSVGANISYSTDESLGGSLTFKDENLLGGDHSISVSANGSIKGSYGVNLGYRNNWIKGTDRLLVGGNIFFNGSKARISDMYSKLPNGISKKDYERYLEDSIFFEPTDKKFTYGISGQVGKGFGTNWYILGSGKLFGVYSKNKYQDINVVTDSETNKPKLEKGKKGIVYEDYNVAALGTSITYDSRDDRSNPKHGLYANIDINGGYIFRDKSITPSDKKVKLEGLNAEIEAPDKNTKTGEFNTRKPRLYISTNLDLRAYHNVIPKYNSMAYRLIGGAAHKNTPSGELFTIGDGITLRGQADVSRYNLGMTATIENRTHINDYLQAVLFYEFGLLGKANTVGKLEPKLAHDIGLGVRINSPVGILRLDYAWDLPAGKLSLNDLKKPTGKLTLGIGNTF